MATTRYYVNDNTKRDGEHEVHTEHCRYLPAPQNRTYLGTYETCDEALVKARQRYRKSNGCFHCANACHT